MLAKRGRGRPKGSKNKRQITIGERAWRHAETFQDNKSHVTSGGLKKRRKRLNEAIKQALCEEDDRCIRKGYSQQVFDDNHAFYQLLYGILRELSLFPQKRGSEELYEKKMALARLFQRALDRVERQLDDLQRKNKT